MDCKSLIENGWFMEKNPQWAGQANSLEVKEVLHHERTKFQDLMVFDSTAWGRVLVLDGVIQLTEKDEMSYQEMMAHLPLYAHPNPKKVLIIGGGDGGVLREVCKHSCVETVTLVDIDEGVINASKTFFPFLAEGFKHSKATVKIGDGVAFVESQPDNTWDVVIVDSSDPVGPAEKLFSVEFYQNVHRILSPIGVLCSQGECLWVHADLIKEMVEIHGKSFSSAEYATIQTPTYPSGQIGAFLATKGLPRGCREPAREVDMDAELRYYSLDMHHAAFALPAFLRRKIYHKSVSQESDAKRQKMAEN
eukprot:GEMP01039285.1.p1 GENE.GEMP01039285.1~~GEMP01039285.1.p1  ORF type:complete len:306 (+),score=65.79 GEMP01039285.1:69-986(+)